MRESYWDKVVAGRVSRRRAIAATGTAALGGAFLAACGGDSKSEGDSSGLLTANVETTDKAVPGGIAQLEEDRDAPSLDPTIQSGRSPLSHTQDVYDRPLFQLPGLNGKPGPLAGNAAESFEVSPDGLTITIKLRQNHVWDPRPPTNGRAMTIADVKWSWDRFTTLSVFAGDMWQGRNKSAPILDMTTPDNRTFVFKLAYPSISLLNLFAHVSYLRFMPIEAEDKFDPRSEARGSGAFFLEKWTPSQSLVYTKNKNWWWKGRPFLDGFVRTIIPDAAASLAQFESGHIWSSELIAQEDILRLKRDHPTLTMRQQPYNKGETGYLVLSQQPDSLMKDVRVRRASSMLLDRDAWVQATFNTDQFATAGLPVKIEWNSHLGASFPEALKPNDPEMAKKLGEGAKYFQYNVAEAKKLLDAAGYKNQPLYYGAHNAPDTQRINQTLAGMLRDGGFNLDYRVQDQNTEYREISQRGGGMLHNGWAFTSASGLDADSYLSSVFLPEGKFGAWRDPNNVPYPELDAMVRKMRVEVDAKKQVGIIEDIQRWAAVNMPNILMPGHSLGFTVTWPWLENHGIFVPDWDGYVFPNEKVMWWYNKEKDPKAKAT